MMLDSCRVVCAMCHHRRRCGARAALSASFKNKMDITDHVPRFGEHLLQHSLCPHLPPPPPPPPTTMTASTRTMRTWWWWWWTTKKIPRAQRRRRPPPPHPPPLRNSRRRPCKDSLLFFSSLPSPSSSSSSLSLAEGFREARVSASARLDAVLCRRRWPAPASRWCR